MNGSLFEDSRASHRERDHETPVPLAVEECACFQLDEGSVSRVDESILCLRSALHSSILNYSIFLKKTLHLSHF